MYRPSGRARRLFCRVIFPGKRSRRKPGRYGIGPYSGAGGVAAMRRRLWRGGVRGGMRASRPTDVLQVSHQPGMHPLLTREPPVGADSISARGVGGTANRADMESAPTAVREGLRPCGGVYGGAGVRDDASIVPYTGLRYRKIAVSRLAAGPIRFAGNGLDRSAEPCTAATGPIWNRPLQRRARGCGQGRRLWRGGGAANAALLYPAQRNIRPQAEAAGVYFTGYWARCQVFCRPAVRAI